MRPSVPAFVLICAVPVAWAAGAGHFSRPLTAVGAGRPTQATVEVGTPREQPLADPRSSALSPRNANYAIRVALDPKTHTLKGHEVLTWRNISKVATSELRFHLYYNAWKNNRSTFFREASLAGGFFGPVRGRATASIDVTALRLVGGPSTRADLMGRKQYISPDDGNTDDRTVLRVDLPGPVRPGETLNVELEWTARVPRTVARTGVLGDFYFIAQWFPKIGVLEDDGWNCHQFHATTEFFADYGVYDVSIAVPTGWTVGATGRERERRDNAGGTTTHRYYQEDVHDFAWTTSPDYLVRTERFEQRGLPSVEMRLLLQPEHASQASRHFAATRAALGSYGEWFGPYPYDHITIVDPAWQSDAGGMEYPTLFTAGTRWLAPGGVTEPELVTVHECGHQFWYALVGNNEFEDAWLDEGLNTYSTARVLERVYGGQNHVSRRYFGGFIPRVFPEIPVRRVDDDGLDSYREGARLDVPSVPSWKYWPIAAGSLSYSKTALWLHTLERFLGWPTFRRCLATYFDRWKFRHPKPADFFQAINEVSGKDLTWFFDQVYRSTCVFDYGVDSVRDGGTSAGSGRSSRSTVVVRRYADGVFPVDVLVRFADGSQVREHWDGRDAWKAFKYERRAGVVSAIVDPDRVLALDVNETNNSRSVNAPSGSASNKWATAWMVWLQDLLLSYGFFV